MKPPMAHGELYWASGSIAVTFTAVNQRVCCPVLISCRPQVNSSGKARACAELFGREGCSILQMEGTPCIMGPGHVWGKVRYLSLNLSSFPSQCFSLELALGTKMESVDDRLPEFFRKGENGRLRVIVARVAAAPTVRAALAINSRLLSSGAAFSDLYVMAPSKKLGCECSRKVNQILLTNHKSDCTLGSVRVKAPKGACTVRAKERT